MSEKLKVLVVRFLLNSNAYLIVLFPLLSKQGLNSKEILFGISIGSFCMILGDGFFSYASDRMGPKIPVMTAGILQAVGVALLPMARDFPTFALAEVIIGVAFPGVYGASLKWLLENAGKTYSDRANQAVFWGSQSVSAIFGVIFFNKPELLCFASAIVYLFAALFAASIKNTRAKTNRSQSTPQLGLGSKVQLVFIGGMTFGIMSSFSWLLQFHASRDFQSPWIIGVAQIIGPAMSLIGSVFSRELRWAFVGALASIIYAFGFFSALSTIVWLGITLALLARGGLSVSTRDSIFQKLADRDSAPQVNFIFGVVSKVFQSVTLSILGTFVH